jgi:hypothetical protein
MPRPCSVDLRERVVRLVEGGPSCRQTANRFQVSVSVKFTLLQRRRWCETVGPACFVMTRSTQHASSTARSPAGAFLPESSRLWRRPRSQAAADPAPQKWTGSGAPCAPCRPVNGSLSPHAGGVNCRTLRYKRTGRGAPRSGSRRYVCERVRPSACGRRFPSARCRGRFPFCSSKEVSVQRQGLGGSPQRRTGRIQTVVATRLSLTHRRN